ncbi:MAG: DnaJ domain-containing protein, partial [Gemmatimonadaceae bacterium]
MSETKLADYYEILQVSPRADRETVERVFRHLANRYHPDNKDSGNTEMFTQLTEA